jgi:hypothetical protein
MVVEGSHSSVALETLPHPEGCFAIGEGEQVMMLVVVVLAEDAYGTGSLPLSELGIMMLHSDAKVRASSEIEPA